ncbi:hypothetical protein M758_UG181400 [Ceratodon purpureus]|nr:hypothetical protein M758_UG181400 [Ceratodon purpureus]
MWQNISSEMVAMGLYRERPGDSLQGYLGPPSQSRRLDSHTEQFVQHFPHYPPLYQVPRPRAPTEFNLHQMESTQGFGVNNNTNQLRGGPGAPMGPPYSTNLMYMGQWGTPSGYPENNGQQIGQGTSIQYEYSPYHPQQLQQMIPPQSVTHQMSPNVTRNNSALGSTIMSKTQYPSNQGKVAPVSPVPLNMPIAPSTYPPTHTPMNLPYYVQGGGTWPVWTTPNSTASFNHGSETHRGPVTNFRPNFSAQGGVPCRPEDVSVYGAIVPVVESKKSAQRRQQRIAKKTLMANNKEWPMRVAATPCGNYIHPSIRLFVHKMIRASAGRFLKLTTIEFRDHPDEDIQNVKKDLEKQLIFDKNLREDYVLNYVESSMKNARYEYHRHWIDTGKGEKHEDCPDRIFPQLVKYWFTKRS